MAYRGLSCAQLTCERVPGMTPINSLSNVGKGSNQLLRQRRWALAELVLLLLAIEAMLWTDNKRLLTPLTRAFAHDAVLAIVAVLLVRQRPDRALLGLKPAGWLRGAGWLVGATGACALAVFVAGWQFGTLGNVENLGRWLARNWHMEGVQQVLLQVLLVPRLTVLLPGAGAAVSWTAAVVFGLLHLPNPVLVVLTTIAGGFWCEWFARYRNLPAVWLSHLVLAAVTLYCLNGPALFNLRVGIGYVLRD